MYTHIFNESENNDKMNRSRHLRIRNRNLLTFPCYLFMKIMKQTLRTPKSITIYPNSMAEVFSHYRPFVWEIHRFSCVGFPSQMEPKHARLWLKLEQWSMVLIHFPCNLGTAATVTSDQRDLVKYRGNSLNVIIIIHKRLTHWSHVTHICVNKLGHHWFR